MGKSRGLVKSYLIQYVLISRLEVETKHFIADVFKLKRVWNFEINALLLIEVFINLKFLVKN
jgi:hypothetical protein